MQEPPILKWPLFHQLDGTMVVTVTIVRIMQVAIDQITDVITVGDCFVTTAGAMHMVGVMSNTLVPLGASRWIHLIDL